MKYAVIVGVASEFPVSQLCQIQQVSESGYYAWIKPFGKIFGDKGYISAKLTQHLLETFMIRPVTKLRKNMKNKLMDEINQYFLRKRAIVESIYSYDPLKNISKLSTLATVV